MKGLLEEERHAKHLVQQQVPSLEGKVSSLQREVDSLQGALDEKDEAHAIKLTETMHDLNQQVTEYSILVSQREGELDALKQDIAVARGDAEATEVQLKLDLKASRDELQATIEDLRSELQDVKKQKEIVETKGLEVKAKLEEDLSAIRKEAAESTLEAKERLRDLEEQYRTSKEKHDVTTRQLEEARSRPAISPAEMAAMEKQVNEVSCMLEEEQKARKEEGTNHQKMAEGLQVKISQLRADLDENKVSFVASRSAERRALQGPGRNPYVTYES